MKKVISTENKPIKLWLDDPEAGALEQAKHLANLPFAFRHIALMPDAHQGYGMPIGGVLATQEVIIPNAVGVDIGCGMCASVCPNEAIAPSHNSNDPRVRMLTGEKGEAWKRGGRRNVRESLLDRIMFNRISMLTDPALDAGRHCFAAKRIYLGRYL